jgi:hypothetical protein
VTQTTPTLALVKPGGGSTGLNTPPDRVDIDVLNGNADKIDAFAAGVGLPAARSTQFYGLAANIGSVTPKVGDEYQESDGNKLLWRHDGSNWVSAEGGLYLIRPTTVVNGTISPDGTIVPTAAAALSVNGVFSSRFRKYRVEFFLRAAATTSFFLQLRGGGVNLSSAVYNWVTMEGSGSTVLFSSATNQTNFPMNNAANQDVWGHVELTNPGHGGASFLKAFETVTHSALGGTQALAHRNGYANGMDANAYDGFNVFQGSTFDATFSWVKVYGLV